MQTKILVLFLSLIIASCGGKKEEETKATATPEKPVFVENDQIIGIGRIIPENQIIQLATSVGGILKNVYKQENDNVVAGEVIATLSNDIENSQLQEAVSQSNVQNQRIKVAQNAIAELESKLDNASNLYNRSKSLYEKGAETKQNLDDSETNYKTLQANINKLKTQINVEKSQLSSSSANTTLYKSRLEQTKIKASCNGKILEWKVRQGEGISAQQTIAQIAPKGNTIVECEIDESLATKVKNEQLAEVRYLGTSDIIAKGKVYFLSDYLKKKSLFSEQSGESEDRRVRLVKILLENPDGLLLNSKVEVIIKTK